ncbi:TPA: alkaline shock response membrane anchor protein AmaP, partial [Enterococcus faecium]|nr:alkaline shock response membrane anchor protein AmaP [Enterococcus faecium]
MNKGVKTIGVIGTLLLLSVLLFAILLSATYPLPFQLEKFRFFSITNSYV